MNKIILSKSVMDFLNAKDERFVKNFYEKIKQLEDDEFNSAKLDIKRFKGNKNRYRLKIGKDKFMFEVID